MRSNFPFSPVGLNVRSGWFVLRLFFAFHSSYEYLDPLVQARAVSPGYGRVYLRPHQPACRRCGKHSNNYVSNIHHAPLDLFYSLECRRLNHTNKTR